MFFKISFNDDGSYEQIGFRIIDGYAVAGFFATHTDKYNIESLKNGGLPIGRYTVVDLATKQVYVDKYRLHNTMVYKNHIITNIIYHLPQELEIDDENETFFKTHGYLEYPKTLIKDLHFVTGNNGVGHSSLWVVDSKPAKVSEYVGVLEKTINRIITKYTPKTFRVSGGLDTRLIATLISKANLGFPDLETLCHPDLTPQQDVDTVIASQLAEKLEQNIKVIECDSSNYHYLGGKEGNILSGMYGGEILGGLAPTLVTPADTERLSDLGKRKYLLELFLSSFRTSIYNSVSFSWSSASTLNSFQYSPFVEQEFLDLFLLTDENEFVDYKLYHKIYQQITTFDLPFSSPITELYSEYKTLPDLINPKLHISPNETIGENLIDTNISNFKNSFLAPSSIES